MLFSRSHAEAAELPRSAATPHTKILRMGKVCAAGLLIAALGVLSACTSGSSGLPPGLQIPSTGSLTLITTSLPDAVAGRTYTVYVVFSGGTAPYGCSASGLPASLMIGATSTTVPAGATNNLGAAACLISGTPAAAGANSVSLTITDSGSPQQHLNLTGVALNVRPELAFTAANFPMGVGGRTYGAGGPSAAAPNMAPVATTNLATPAGNAPLTSCTLSGAFVSSNPGVTASPALAGNAMGCPVMTSMGMTLSAVAVQTTSAVVFTAMDTPIVDPFTGLTAVPAGMVSNTTQMAPVAYSVTVNPALTLAVDAASAAVNPAPNGVHGRTYGNTGAGFKDLAFDAAQGLPPYVFGAVSSIGSPGTGVPAAVTCSMTSATKEECTSGAAAVTASAGAYTFSISLNDTANSAVPSASTSGTQPAAIPGSITIRNSLAVSLPSPNPVTPAVNGRPYGTPAGSQDLIYTVAAGEGLPTVSIMGAGFPGPITCPTQMNAADSTLTLTCNSSNNPVIGATATGTITVTDAANATTPAATAASDPSSQRMDQITVNAALTLAIDVNSAAVNPAPAAVMGRSYGNTAAGFKDLAFDASGGLPAYTFGLPATINAPGTGVPTAVACTATSGTKAECTSGASTVTAAIGAYSFSITLNDTANATTPNASTSGTQPAAIPGSITVNSPLALSLDATSVDPPPFGVVNRTYGNTGAGFKALIYDASGGIPSGAGYTFTLPATVNNPTADGVPTPVACTANGANTIVTCTGGAAAVTAASGNYPFQITANDTASTTTPNGATSGTTAMVSKTITIRKQLAISLPSPNPVSDAVAGRPYGTPAGSQDLTYMVLTGEGLPTVTITGAGFPTTITCPMQMNAADSTLTLHCNSGGAGTQVTGTTSTGTITVTDTANATTPAATTGTDPNSQRMDQITVDPELTIGNTFLENGTVGEPYSAIFYSNGGGIPFGASPVYHWSTTAGGLAGVAFVNPAPAHPDDLTQARGYYVGTPTTANTPGTPTVTTTFTVMDTSNPTTPSCSTAATCPTFTTTNKVLPEDGFVATYASGAAEQGDTVVSFDSNAFSASHFISLNTDAGFDANPVAARVSPDGEWVYVPKQGNTHDVSVVDSVKTVNGCSPAASCASNDLAVKSIVVFNTGTFNPSSIDIAPQRFFATPFACGTQPCSVQRNFRYDAWLSDPTDGNQPNATVEPIPDAENPGLVTTPLSGTGSVTVPDANNIALSTDGSLAFVSLNYLPSDTACGAPPCNTLSVLNLPATPISSAATVATTLNTFGLRAGAVTADPRGNNVYTATRSNDGTHTYITVTTASAAPSFVTYIPATAGPANTVDVCSNNGVPEGLVVSPDGNRLFIACLDTTNSPQTDNVVDVWDVSPSGTFATPAATISLPVSVDSSTAPHPANAENGCETPVDIKARLTKDGTTSAFGTRLFVSCQDSDTVVPVDFNTATDAFAVRSVISTDSTPIANAANPPYVNACGNGGSCPQLLDLMVNPPLHFTTGGYAPASPFALPAATSGNAYDTFVVASGGTVVDSTGGVTRTWSNPDGVLASDPNCAGLTLNTNTGEIFGTANGTSGTTCGGANGFIIRVTDASATMTTPAGQFVERAFTIHVN